eukprot:TRINITY_DN78096_c0_g1_i1.p1 TRINITY_DN78096_c0_g1~~TRINITY_DN78096_c0_g1_i1.p1  ORF type:complete len:403 (-),score=50.97 TRINITY_DN78096_c0_g1_i1:2092-3300(-)
MTEVKNSTARVLNPRSSFSAETTECLLRLQHESTDSIQTPEKSANCALGSCLEALRNIASSVEHAAKSDGSVGGINLFICAAVKPALAASEVLSSPQNPSFVQLWNSINPSDMPFIHETENATLDRFMSVYRESNAQPPITTALQEERNENPHTSIPVHREFMSEVQERTTQSDDNPASTGTVREVPSFDGEPSDSPQSTSPVLTGEQVLGFDRVPSGEGVYRAAESMASQVATWLLNGTGYSMHHKGELPSWPQSYSLISCRLITEALGRVFKEEKRSRGIRGLKYSALLPNNPSIHTVILPLDRGSDRQRKQKDPDRVVRLILKKAKRTKKGAAFGAFCILVDAEGMDGPCAQELQRFSEEGLGSTGCERRRRVGLRVDTCKVSPPCLVIDKDTGGVHTT